MLSCQHGSRCYNFSWVIKGMFSAVRQPPRGMLTSYMNPRGLDTTIRPQEARFGGAISTRRPKVAHPGTA